MRPLFLYILFFFLPVLTFGQKQPLYTHFKSFKVEDGLPQSFISSLVQDKNGFLWVGTRDGLARYDGREFKTFRHKANDPKTILSNVITGLYCDSENKLWIRFENAPFACFDPQSFQVQNNFSFPQEDTLFRLRMPPFFTDGNGRYWTVDYLRGIFSWEKTTGKINYFNRKNNKLYSDSVLSATTDNEGRIWIYHIHGLEVSDQLRSGFQFIPFPSSVKFSLYKEKWYPIACLPDGNIFMADSSQIIVYNTKKKSFGVIPFGIIESSVPGIIRKMRAGIDGKLYLEKSGSIFRLENNGEFTYLWDYPNTKFDYAEGLLLDKSNTLWFGTNAAGLYKIDFASLPFTSLPYQQNFHVDVLSKLPGVIPQNIPKDLSSTATSYFWRYSYAKDSTLFFLYDDRKNNGLIYHLKQGKFFPLRFPPGSHLSPASFCIGENKKIYAIDQGQNLWVWDDFNQLPGVKPLKAVGSTTMDMVMDKTGDIWVSSYQSGFYQLRKDEVFRHFTKTDKKNGLPTNQLTDIFQDPDYDELIWVGTLGEGLVLWDKTKGVKKVFLMNDGLPNNTIYAIVPDNSGNIWLSTNNGICRLNRHDYSIKNFDINDGLLENEFNRFHAFQFPDGRMAFGSGTGYTVFDPSKSVPDTFATAVSITNFSVNNETVEFDSGNKILSKPINELSRLDLPYDKNFLSFEFAGLQFNQTGKIRYRYMLKGYDNNWIETGNRNIANYTKLPPGHYTLLLNASNTSGTWSPMVKELSIRIRPPFWATWWAYTIYALIVLMLARIYWRYRTNRIKMQNEIALEHSKAQHLKEVDEIKNRFFSNITHELRTPLTLILTPLEKLKQENKYSPADQRILSNAYKNAGQLLRLINQLLDISKIESGQMKVNATVGELSEFVERCCQQFSLQAKEKNIQLYFTIKDVRGHYLFDEEKWEKIIFNLLGNAIKFTPENGRVTVELIDKKGTAQLTVSDTGPGIHEEDFPKIFDRFYMADDSATRKQGGTGIGLALVKELVELMKGKIGVKSVYGQGSTFIVEVPVEKTADSTGIQTKPAERIIASNEMKDEITREEKKEGPLVLVVEDNDELRSFLVESLSSEWKVLQAANGKLGWEIILNELPDLVISDVMMPEMDGFELCQLVKDDMRTGHISFILLTAKAAHESRLTGLKKGADAYLSKPFHFDELEQRLQNLVQQQERIRKHLQNELLPKAPLRKLPHVNDLFIQELYKQLDERLDDPNMSVEALAQAMAMSQRTLNRKLKAILNVSPVEFIRQFRLQKAAILLSSGHGVADAAYTVGFETASYFTQCFKEQFGKTPTEFASQKTA